MYICGTVVLELVKTYAFIGEDKFDQRDGMMVAELRSPDGRYHLTTDMETFTGLSPAPKDQAGLKGLNGIAGQPFLTPV